MVAARDPEGVVDKCRGVLEELENISVEGGGVVTRNKVLRLELCGSGIGKIDLGL